VTGVVYTDTRTGEEYGSRPAWSCSAYVRQHLLAVPPGIGEPYDPKTGKGAGGTTATSSPHGRDDVLREQSSTRSWARPAAMA
jgi:hypothetical protein